MAKRKLPQQESKTSEPLPCRHSKAHFNLIDEPWIPVVWKPDAVGMPGRSGVDAKPPELGLSDTLLYAHEIVEVADPSPLVTAALHRLLIAVVHAIYRGPENRKDWAEMWETAVFDPDKVCGYFKQWHERFWLFYPERPFLQRSGDDLGNPMPSTLLNMAAASTSDATLFDHSLDSLHLGFTCAEAARQLMAFLTFKTGGFVEGVTGDRDKASALAAPWADGAAFLSQYENLFGTIMMNLVLPERRNGILFALGIPEWENSHPSQRTPPKQSRQAGPPLSYLQFLTAPSRQVLLSEPDSSGMIRVVCLQLGTVFMADAPLDPAKAYIADKKKGWRPVGLRENRELWRDSATLLKASNEEQSQAGSLGQIAALRESDILPADLVVGLRAFGTIGSQAKVDLWRAETLPIPVSLLENPDRRTLIEDCMALAEGVERALGQAAWALVRCLVPRSKEEKDRKALRDHLDSTRPFWTALETPFKRDVLFSPPTADLERVRNQWAEKCMALARDVLIKSLDGLAASGKSLHGGAEAERTLGVQLAQLRQDHNIQ